MSLYYAYIIYSDVSDEFYAGHTNSLSARLRRHNKGGSFHTSRSTAWKIVYQMTFKTRKEAIIHEKTIKKKGVRSFYNHYKTKLADGRRPQAPVPLTGD